MNVMQATRALLFHAASSQRRAIAAEASAFLPISVVGALSLSRPGMTVEELRAVILEHLERKDRA